MNKNYNKLVIFPAVIVLLLEQVFAKECLPLRFDNHYGAHKPINIPYHYPSTWFRLGKTRFYIHATNDTHTYSRMKETQWSEGTLRVCRPYLDEKARTPILDLISTNAIIARLLEQTVTRNNLKQFTFWIGAKSGSDVKGNYIWHGKSFAGWPLDRTNSRIAYSNFFYRAPRTIGLTKTNKRNYYGKEPEELQLEQVHTTAPPAPELEALVDRCIAFGLPFKNKPHLGFQTSWIETDCNHKFTPMCEVPYPECEENRSTNPHVLTEDKEYYYTEGNWIFSNRRFVVNLKPRTKTEAQRYCVGYGMELFAPTPQDMCLIPNLKMWFTVLSTYHFWTQYQFNTREKSFYDKDGKLLQREAKKAYHYLGGRGEQQESKIEAVSYIWTYERKNETSCTEPACSSWMYYMLAPVNENVPIGTICQHKQADNTRPCLFESLWNDDFTLALEPTAVVEFGFRGSQFWRSTYKQLFGNRICGGNNDERAMVEVDVDYWTPLNEDPSRIEFVYDYNETYWVVDEERFTHSEKHAQLCTVSNLTKTSGRWERNLFKVNCDEWHFYLCMLVI